MAPSFDKVYDTTPANPRAKARGPKISDMKAALSTFNATSYTADRLNAMTKNDLVHAITVHNLTVAGV